MVEKKLIFLHFVPCLWCCDSRNSLCPFFVTVSDGRKICLSLPGDVSLISIPSILKSHWKFLEKYYYSAWKGHECVKYILLEFLKYCWDIIFFQTTYVTCNHGCLWACNSQLKAFHSIAFDIFWPQLKCRPAALHSHPWINVQNAFNYRQDLVNLVIQWL